MAKKETVTKVYKTELEFEQEAKEKNEKLLSKRSVKKQKEIDEMFDELNSMVVLIENVNKIINGNHEFSYKYLENKKRFFTDEEKDKIYLMGRKCEIIVDTWIHNRKYGEYHGITILDVVFGRLQAYIYQNNPWHLKKEIKLERNIKVKIKK